MHDLNLRDLNLIIDALADVYTSAKNEDKKLTEFTLRKVAEMRAQHIEWLYQEYSA